MIPRTRKNVDILASVIGLLFVIIICLVATCVVISKNRNNNFKISNNMIKDKYNSLVSKMGDPIYLKTDKDNNLFSATWQQPLDNWNVPGKFGGCDVIKLFGEPVLKQHPHKAIVFIVIGKYINVPDKLLGPLKYASETINIDQLFIPKKYQEIYQSTGEKQVALVTGSCASVTISVITVQFVMDMIEQYKDSKEHNELYEVFRAEYDRRINDYLCGDGITDPIPWYDPGMFDEPNKDYIGDEKCAKTKENLLSNVSEFFKTHFNTPTTSS